MNGSQRVQACRLCLAMNIKLLEIEMGLKNSVKSMLGENVYYTSGLPSYVCFECAALLRKYTKFRRKCRRVQTFLYGILKNNGEVTEVELNKIDRKKLGLESSLSTRNVALDSYSQPTEVVKEEIVDTDLGLTVEDNIDIKIEEPTIDDTFYQEHGDMSTLTDVNNIQTDRNWSPQNQEDNFLEYMPTLKSGPYLKERKIENQDMTKNLRNSGNHYDSISNNIGNYYTLPNIKLPLSTTITPIPSQNNVCKKISEHEHAQDVNRETDLVLPDIEIKVASIMPQLQDNGRVKHIENLTGFAVHDLNTVNDKQLQGLNDTFNNRRILDRYANGKINSNSTAGPIMKNNDYHNDSQQDKFYISDFARNKNSCVNSITITKLKEKRKSAGELSDANISEISVNEYMEAIELLPHKRVRGKGTNRQLRNFDTSCENKISTEVTYYENNEHHIVPKQEKSQGNVKNQLNYQDIEDSDTNSLLIDRNIANANRYDTTEMNKVNCRVIKDSKAVKVEFKANQKTEDFKLENERSKNKGRKAKKRRKRTYSDDFIAFKPRRKVVHRNWSKEEMEVVSRRFCQELSLNQNPGMAKCKLVLEQEPALNGRTWMQLNSCVNNLYMKKIKNQRRLAAKLEEGKPVPFHSHLSLPSQVLAMRRVSSGD